ncbi:MAG TPA: thiamine pyrophosphate-dependent enzyme [Actinomycetota bacterium]|nr:thiamine pyrophosphate-dependent enzyme [Actinomycetota bacterium]
MTTAREAFFEVARSEGARYLFTNPGTTELPIFDELVDDTGIELILCLQEGVAMGAADGYAAATGRPSLVNLHIAPGLANGLCGMYNAMWGRSPVVVTAGQQDTRQLVLDPMLAGDLVGMAAPFSKWSYECRRPEEVGVAMRRAFQFAAAPPQGPTFVSIPWDVFDQDADFEVPARSEIDHASPPSKSAIEAAARLLAAAERPVIVAGDAVARAGAVPDLVRLAETCGARVAAEPIAGRLVFPTDHPLWAGTMLPNHAGIRAVLEQADVALLAGVVAFSPLMPAPVSPVPPGVTLIQIDEDPYEIAKTYPVEVGMRGDLRAAAAMIADTVAASLSPAQQGAVGARVARYTAEREAAIAGLQSAIDAARDAKPIKPIVACAEIAGAIEPGTCVVDESVTATLALRGTLTLGEPGSYFFTRGGGLGFGLPASIGVKLARPDQPVVAVVGDGTTLYTPQALWTMAHHDVPVVAVVLNNASYLILKAGMITMAGKAAKAGEFPGMDLTDPPVDFPALAASFGVAAERVEVAADIAPAIRAAVASGKPALIEVVVDGSLG